MKNINLEVLERVARYYRFFYWDNKERSVILICPRLKPNLWIWEYNEFQKALWFYYGAMKPKQMKAPDQD